MISDSQMIYKWLISISHKILLYGGLEQALTVWFVVVNR